MSDVIQGAASEAVLYHYSPTPFVYDPLHIYDPKMGHFKPSGLWVSVEGTDDDWGWKQWCEMEEWNNGGLAHRVEIILRPDANILRLSTVAEMHTFTHCYTDRLHRIYGMHGQIDWTRVMSQHDGIIIAPYHYSLRLSMGWYYPWDCASGCIWNTAAIQEVL